MKNKQLRLLLRIALIAQLLVLILMITSCGGYKRYSLKEGSAHFSFECPSLYKPKLLNLEGKQYETTMIGLYTIDQKNPEDSYHDAEIFIDIRKAGGRYSNSMDSLESSILLGPNNFDDFRLLERSSVEFAGIKGDQIVYSYARQKIEDIPTGYDVVRPPVIVRAVFFDYNGQIWYISVVAHESYVDTAREDYDHILETFKILD